MANIFDYLTDVQYDSFYDLPLNELDILALTELTYLSFDNLLDQPVNRLSDVATRVPRETNMLTNKERLQLLDQLSQHKRFKNSKLSNFVNDIDTEQQKQFAAMTYRLDLDTYLIVFRGTDDSIIGWKEDFHMTYMKEIPAQKHALEYLEDFFTQHPKQKVIVAGHSKGGNLAVYAASQIQPELQDKISAVYTYDAPGLQAHLTETTGYQDVITKIHRFVPQGSVIGMMLEVPDAPIVVKSTALGGIAQHSTFSWQTEDNHFVQLESISSESLQIKDTLKEWVDSVPDEELELYFDLFFGTILESGISSINELSSKNAIDHVRQLVSQAQTLEPEQVEILKNLSQLLLDARFQAWKNHF
ncbi:DUF2974 domain-containing protein [Streptococcus sp. oral taxon 431]|uniref:DUF2974 domain-containing protein n=1 Tax=Streptococcus sp. oral taxon 431 TaxID=712633 RepID=UPI0020038C9F|nr:DUF2974 domain-containing protein [Streptococcus sp. oral taxon 431]